MTDCNYKLVFQGTVWSRKLGFDDDDGTFLITGISNESNISYQDAAKTQHIVFANPAPLTKIMTNMTTSAMLSN